MLAITNTLTPEKLNQRFKLPSLPKIGMDKKEQVLQTREQMTRRKHNFYTPQIPSIRSSLLNG